tara:strand:+ start:423 stop:629 length:207 start_codon:yes stop_codon:yes gene_type:complete
MSKCIYCKKVITLVPSASERAAKFGGKASDYTKLFTSHSACMVAARDKRPNPVNGKKFDWIDGEMIEV